MPKDVFTYLEIRSLNQEALSEHVCMQFQLPYLKTCAGMLLRKLNLYAALGASLRLSGIRNWRTISEAQVQFPARAAGE